MSVEREVGITFKLNGAEAAEQKINSLNILYEKLTRQADALSAQLQRSSLSQENQSAAFDLMATKGKAAGAALDFLNSTENVSAKTTSAASAIMNDYAKALNLVASASKQSAQPNVAPTSQALLDSQIRLARAQGDYTQALELNHRAQLLAEGDEERLAELKVQEIQINKQVESGVRSEELARRGITQEMKDQALAMIALRQQQEAALIQQAQQANVTSETGGSNLLRILPKEGVVTPHTAGVDPDVLNALVQGSKNTTQLKEALVQLGLASNLSAEQLKQLGLSADDLGAKATTRAVPGIGGITREARGMRDAVFGAALAINLMQSAVGDQLPPAAKQASQSLRLVADSMLAVAFLAPQLGGIGLLLGASVGVLAALGASAMTVDPQIKALNDSLAALGKKDDAAQGLSKLTNVTDTTAQAALDYVKANQGLASSFDNLVHQAQPAIPVLQGVGDALRAATTANHDFFQSIRDTLPVYDQWAKFLETLPQRLQLGAVHQKAYNDAIAQGKTQYEAIAAASQAVAEAMNAQDPAITALTKQTQAYANAQNELNNITLRDTINKAQDTIDKLRLQGATTDELRIAVLKLLQAQQELNGVTPSFMGARVQAISPIGQSQVDAEAARQQKNLSIFNDIAQKLYSDLLDAQQNYNDSSATLSEDHNARLQEIANSGAEQVLRINREFAQRLLDIQQNLIDSEASALDDLNSSIADAEENAQDRRNTINQDYADKRVQIEKDYQDKIAQIWSTYAASLLDIEARRDDLGLLRARQTRDKQLKDAADQKQKDDDAASKQREKDLKALDDALRKQEEKIRDAYEKRIKALEDQAAKERAKAEQNHTDQLNDQATAQQKQVDSENLSYRNRQEQLDRALANRKDALIKSLVADKAITEEYGRAIIESLRGILDPDVIASLLNDLQQQLSAKVTVSITTIGTFVPPTGPIGTKFELGGRVPFTMSALVHAEETILPKIADAGSMNRAYNLAMAHLSGGRVAPPQTIFSSSAGSFSGVIDLNVYPVVNDGVFNARVEAVSYNTIVRVNQRSR